MGTDNRHALSRREFLGSTIAALSLVPLNFNPLQFATPSSPLGALLQHLDGREHVYDIAREYLRLVPGFDRNASFALASERLGRLCNQSESLAAAVQCSIEEDFRSGETVLIQGWLLSKTEVEICVLAAPLPAVSVGV